MPLVHVENRGTNAERAERANATNAERQLLHHARVRQAVERCQPTDSVESHRKFAEHHDLPLRLLSDADRAVAKLYGAISLLPGRVARSVFVIDARGILRYSDVRPIGLVKPTDDATLAAIRAAQKEV